MQWGDEYRALHTAVWRIVVRLLDPGGLFVLNIKDHVRDGARMPVSGWHVSTLLALGLRYVDDNAVATRGLGGGGDNAESREGVEHVYLLSKPPLLDHEKRNGGTYDPAYRNELPRRAQARARARVSWPGEAQGS